MDQFEAYFQKADLDRDGRISGHEAVSFFQAFSLPKQVLAQIWTYADQNQTGFLSCQQFYNALKLVTVAQSKRELTPDIVKAALYSPASAKIPAPKINDVVASGPHPNSKPGAPVAPATGAAPLATPNGGIAGSQGFPSKQNQLISTPRLPTPNATLQPQSGVSSPGMPAGSSMPAFRSPNSSNWLGGGTVGPQPGVVPQFPNKGVNLNSQDGFGIAASGLASSQSKPQEATSLVQRSSPHSNHSASLGHQPPAKDSRATQVTGNGFASNSHFGDVFSATSVLPKQDSKPLTSSAGSLPASSALVPVSTGSQPNIKPSSINPLEITNSQQSVSHQYQQTQPTMKPNQRVPLQSSTIVHEILRQVWDLSDQDNDSMLSLREFCISLYLMERYREGHPLPSVLPSSIMLDETLALASGKPPAAYPGAAWKHTPGLQQAQGVKGPRQAASAPLGKPPRPASITHLDEAKPPTQQKPKVPVLEKHLVDQLSTEEQSSLTSKFKEATDAEKKVAELEKEILDAKEKTHFYHTKMQELILYKSRCDNRLNEITERASSDKKEVESLAKKYEEKYKQSGDVASKLTIEEATFRDIQEKKMELYRAIVKMDQDGKADGIQDHANHIQLDIEKLVKSLNERCKTYGLRAKPTSLLELPFGWQPGIQEGAADWDEDWDKFEDEGFTLLKELTLDVANVIAPPKQKSSLIRDKVSLDDSETEKSHSEAGARTEKLSTVEDEASVLTGEQRAESPPESPSKTKHVESPSKEYHESQTRKEVSFDGSPHAPHSEHRGAESVFSGGKGFDESDWGAFDTQYDADAAWNFNDVASKDGDHVKDKETSLFDSDDWGLAPIKTGSKHADDTFPKQSPFFDSVPSTPNYNIGPIGAADPFPKHGLFFDSVPSTPSYNIGPMGTSDGLQKQSAFFDSVPSTPSYNVGSTHGGDAFSKQSPFLDSVPSTPSHNAGFSYTENASSKSPFFDSVPSTPSYGSSLHADDMFRGKSLYAFADSVPSTPMYSSNSPRRFSEGSEEHSKDFSRFDSFNMQDGGLFASGSGASFTRFDSMGSTRDSDYGHDLFSSSRDSLARFDSFRSTADSEYTFGNYAPQESSSFARFDSMRSTKDSDYGQHFSSFDDADPFGSSGPFKTSLESETPRRDSDHWSGPFKTSLESETPRRDSGHWNAF
nr:epidermal growth factor receptor substrate 15-like 1 [Ipomoea batatas]